jgi:hypothetical protein
MVHEIRKQIVTMLSLESQLRNTVWISKGGIYP